MREKVGDIVIAILGAVAIIVVLLALLLPTATRPVDCDEIRTRASVEKYVPIPKQCGGK